MQTKNLPQKPECKELTPVNSNTTPQVTDGLSLYLREINRFPVLSPEEEIELARRYREHNDQEAAWKLITSNLRLVVKIAMEFQRKWMQNVMDLIQEGNVGLMKAVQKFNPDRGIKFSYYAAFWIKAYILKFIMENWRMVKIGTTQAQRKLFYNLNKEKKRLESMGIVPNAEKISQQLNVSKQDVIEMGKRMGQKDLSLDTPLSNDEEDFTPLHTLPALESSVEEQFEQTETAQILQEKLKSLIPKLNPKEKDILTQRLLSDNPITLREIGEKYGITRERVRQIEARLLEKIKKHLQAEIKDFSMDWIVER